MKPEVSERLFIESLFEKSKPKLPEAEELIDEKVERLTGDASTRRYYRLETNKNSYVACIDNPSDDNSNTFVRMQEFLEKYKIRVPKIYDRNLKRGYILEEDLGDVTLLQHLSFLKTEDEELRIYKEIIDSLVGMHKIPSAEINSSGVFSNSFDFEKLFSEIRFTTHYFMKIFLGINDEREINKVEESFIPILKRLAEKKMVFTHRDFHSRNIMVKNGEFVIIDFQDARWGVPQYDLVSILEDCYYKIKSNNKKELVKYYYEQVGEEIHGEKNFVQFMEIYNDMALQRVFKAVGSFSYIYETRKDVRYIKYIGFAMEKIKRIMYQDPKYDELRTILFKHYYES